MEVLREVLGLLLPRTAQLRRRISCIADQGTRVEIPRLQSRFCAPGVCATAERVGDVAGD
jgi:hypothetical protein